MLKTTSLELYKNRRTHQNYLGILDINTVGVLSAVSAETEQESCFRMFSRDGFCCFDVLMFCRCTLQPLLPPPLGGAGG